MVVHALELYGNAVNTESPLFVHGIRNKADLLRDFFSRRLKNERIKIRILCVPEHGIFYLEGNAVLCALLFKQTVAIVKRDLCLALECGKNCVCLGVKVDINKMSLGAGKKINVAENAVEAEEILVLKIASRAPLMYLGNDAVFADLYKRRHVKFCLQVVALAVTDVCAVDVERNVGANALENDVMLLFVVRNFEISRINAERIVIGNIGWIYRIGIENVGVVRILIAEKLPAGGIRFLQ